MELKMKFASLTAAAMVACALVATPVLANDVTARDGANTGDTVTLHFPFSMILCSEDTDALAVYMAGVMARSESLRLESDDMMVALKAESAARKEALRTAYSCQRADRKGGDNARYTVTNKILPRDPNGTSALDAVRYTITRDGKSWMFCEFVHDPSPFSH
jgi:hypothetical protein